MYIKPLIRLGLVNQLIFQLEVTQGETTILIKTLGIILGDSLVEKCYVKQGLPILCKALRQEQHSSFVLGVLQRITLHHQQLLFVALFEMKGLPLLIHLFLQLFDSLK